MSTIATLILVTKGRSGLQILTTLPVLCDDSCSAQVGGGRSVPPVPFIIFSVGGGNVADCPDEVGWGSGPKKD